MNSQRVVTALILTLLMPCMSNADNTIDEVAALQLKLHTEKDAMQVSAEDFDGYHIQLSGESIKGGERDYLSAKENGKGAEMWYTDGGTGRQLWVLVNCTESDCTNGEKYIKVFGGVKTGGFFGAPPDAVYLSANWRGTEVDLWDQDDGSGRQRWLISKCEDAGCGPDDHHIKISGGITKKLFEPGKRVYLSSTADGKKVDLYWEDDGEGRQRWKITPAKAKPHDSFQLSMGELANAVYYPQAIPGWQMGEGFIDDNDKVQLYYSGDKCAIAVSGSDDLTDWIQDITFIPKAACGTNIHTGFHDEAKRLADHPKFVELKEHFVSKKCKGGRYVSGHSLGGAVVSVMAGCIEYWESLKGIKLDGLWTFGAPGISSEPLTAKGGKCFPGTRFFNMDLTGGDPVPWATSVGSLVGIPMKHPKVEAVRLRNWFGKTKETFACDDPDTPLQPSWATFVVRPMKHVNSAYKEMISLLF